jgi:3-deoxy-7-phosphoheptulonate synthase
MPHREGKNEPPGTLQLAMRRQTDDLRIMETRPLIPPAILIEELPVSDEGSDLIFRTRSAIADILHGRDRRLLVVVGPCSIHDPAAALEVAHRLRAVADEVGDSLLIVMRAYFEKPRTNVGWKGLINDPDLDESFRINHGLRLARKLLVDVNDLGLPTGSEFLDLQIPQHISDLTSWVAIGARTTESQVHRELASGLSMPVGFKNTTEGNLTQAIDAIKTARSPHWFPSVTKEAVGAIFHTRGNDDCHVILRGGTASGPNYDEKSIQDACTLLEKNGLPPRVMVDCSHGNSEKDYRRQGVVLKELARQISQGKRQVMGLMLEANLVEGRQDINLGRELVYGQSVTDSCISIDEARTLLCELAEAAS